MTKKIGSAILILAGLFSISATVSAHHGNAAFETAKSLTMKTTVTDWYWANPHCFLKFDYKNDKGEVEHWVVETSNPADMINKGWSKEVMKPGDQVTVEIFPVKNGKPVGRLIHITLPSGQTLGN